MTEYQRTETTKEAFLYFTGAAVREPVGEPLDPRRVVPTLCEEFGASVEEIVAATGWPADEVASIAAAWQAKQAK